MEIMASELWIGHGLGMNATYMFKPTKKIYIEELLVDTGEKQILNPSEKPCLSYMPT